VGDSATVHVMVSRKEQVVYSPPHVSTSLNISTHSIRSCGGLHSDEGGVKIKCSIAP
jgi:hypothetical protein